MLKNLSVRISECGPDYFFDGQSLIRILIEISSVGLNQSGMRLDWRSYSHTLAQAAKN